MDKEKLTKKTLEDLRRIYPQGLYEYLFKFRKPEYDRLLALEGVIVDSILNPELRNDELRVDLRKYWIVHQEAIKDFYNSNQDNTKLQEAKEELYDYRMSASEKR